jgi:hypothetical protein
MLLAFIAGISLNLARGKKPDCHCSATAFQLIGWPTLARNGILAVWRVHCAQGHTHPARCY